MKKRIASIALSLAMCLTLLPTAAYAEDVSEGGAFDSQPSTVNGAAVYTNEDTVDDTSADKVNVRTKDELKSALANNDVNIIYITDSFKYTDSIATVYKGNIIKNLIMDCQSYTKYRPNETTGGIFVSWRRKEELPTGA